MFGLQPQDLLVILIVALLLFGPNQLPKIARGLGKTLAEFRKAITEVGQAAESVRESLSEPPLLVFVSSIMNPKCDDLIAERAAAKRAIEALPLARSWRFEDSPASPETAPRVYLRKVRECDIFVLVLGKEITYPVLREYATARKHKRPRLAFLKKCDRTPATQQFVRHISSEVKWKDFSASVDLEKQIKIAIVDLLLLKFRDKLTANEIIVLTGLLSELTKPEIPAPTPPAEAEPVSPEPRIEVVEPEPPRVKTPEPPSLFAPHTIRGRDGKRMILIPAGEFWRGTSDEDAQEMRARLGFDPWGNEMPQRKIYLDAYYIDETPVTNEEYQRFVLATGHRVPFYDADWAKPYNWDKLLRTFPPGKGKHPVVLVSWEDANAYARWAGKRLPTEAEWEKAARGGIYLDGDQWRLHPNPNPKRFYPWGNAAPDRTRCNFDGNEGGTTPVGKYSPRGDSPYHIKDMAGNVWEWCADGYDSDYYKNSPRENPKNETSEIWRVLRGGSWFSIASLVRAAYRSYDDPDYRYSLVGFRCAQ